MRRTLSFAKEPAETGTEIDDERGHAVMASSLRVPGEGGVSLHVRRWHGARSAEQRDLCLLVHGFADNSQVWSQFASEAAALYPVCAVDLRGHGDSAWDPEARYRVETYTHDLISVINALGCDRVVLVGHSMGGEVTLHVAQECRDRLLGLVLVDFGPKLDPDGLRRVRAEFRASDQHYATAADYAARQAQVRPLVRRAALEAFAAASLRACGTGLRLKADPAIASSEENEPVAARDEAQLWDMLASVVAPVLIVRGVGSAVLRQDVVEQMMTILPEPCFQAVPCAGHAVMLDNPEGFAEAVCPFLQRLRQRTEAE